MSTSKQRGWSFGIRSIGCWATLLVAGAVPLAAQTSAPASPAPAEEDRDSEPVFHVIAPESKISVIHLQSRTLEFSKRIKEVEEAYRLARDILPGHGDRDLESGLSASQDAAADRREASESDRQVAKKLSSWEVVHDFLKGGLLTRMEQDRFA